METTFIFPSDNTRFKENGSENTLSNDLELTPFKDFLLRKGASDNTIRIYLLAVRHFFSHSDTIDPENLQAHKAWLLEHYRPATVNVHIHGINQFLLFLKSYPSLFLKFSEQPDFSCLPENFKLPAVKYQQKTFLDNVISKRNYEILKKRLKQDENWFWYFIVRFLGATGMRVSELLRLNLEDLNLRLGYVVCHDEDKERVIPIGNVCKTAMEKYLKEARGKFVKENETESLFTNCSGKSMSRQGFWKVLKGYAEEAGIQHDITPHTLRHSFAAHMLQNGADVKSVQEMLGHSDISTTQVYLNFGVAKMRDVYMKAHPRH